MAPNVRRKVAFPTAALAVLPSSRLPAFPPSRLPVLPPYRPNVTAPLAAVSTVNEKMSGRA